MVEGFGAQLGRLHVAEDASQLGCECVGTLALVLFVLVDELHGFHFIAAMLRASLLELVVTHIDLNTSPCRFHHDSAVDLVVGEFLLQSFIILSVR